MFALLPYRGPHPRTAKTGVRLRRLAAVVAAVTGGLLASATTIPAAFARIVPATGGPYGPVRPAPVPAATIRVVTSGGMPGWQITMIALGAALLAAAAAVLLDRALAGRRAAASAPAT